MSSITIPNVNPSDIVKEIQKVVKRSKVAAKKKLKPEIPIYDPNHPPQDCQMYLDDTDEVPSGDENFPGCDGPCAAKGSKCVFFLNYDGGTRVLEFGCRCTKA